jgi:hypothetical protein
MGTTCSQTLAPYKEPEPRPLDPMGETRIRLSKEVYPALCDEDFSWMKSTKGALVITGEDEKDIESPNAKVHRLKTEEALQKLIEGRQLVNTTVIRWYNIYAVTLQSMGPLVRKHWLLIKSPSLAPLTQWGKLEFDYQRRYTPPCVMRTSAG